jgi:hypothetical protein
LQAGGDCNFGYFTFGLNKKGENEPLSQDEMHVKIPLLSRDLKLSKFKPGCRVAVLPSFEKQIPPIYIDTTNIYHASDRRKSMSE